MVSWKWLADRMVFAYAPYISTHKRLIGKPSNLKFVSTSRTKYVENVMHDVSGDVLPACYSIKPQKIYQWYDLY